MMIFDFDGNKKREHWYRYRDYQVGDLIDGYGDPVPGTSHTRVVLDKYEVLRHTLKGAWISYGYKETKFVLKGEGKRFCYPTKEAAKQSFIRRKQRQIGINKAAIVQAKAALKLITEDKVATDPLFFLESIDV